MSHARSVSRRASLKSLGAVGAVLVLDGSTAAAPQVDPKPAGGVRGDQTVSVGEAAIGRFAKGHS